MSATLNSMPPEFWLAVTNILTFIAGLLINPKKNKKNVNRNA